VSHTVGRNVFGDGGIALADSIVADLDKLVETGPSAEEAKAANLDVTCDKNPICKVVTVSNMHIVGEVAIDHKHIVISHCGETTFAGAAVNSHVLADRIVVTY
jgi:hypothetical protein